MTSKGTIRAWWFVLALGVVSVVCMAWLGNWATAAAVALCWVMQIVVMVRRGLFTRGEQ